MALRKTFASLRSFRTICSPNSSLHTYPAFCYLDKSQFKSRVGGKGERDYLEYKQVVADFIHKKCLNGVDNLKKNIIESSRTWNEHTFDSYFLSVCTEIGAFDLGKRYFVKLHEEGKAGLGAIGKYFALCYRRKDECEADDIQLILKIYDNVLTKYGILDTSTCELFAQGIGLTEKWRSEIPKLLDMIGYSGAKSSPSMLTTAVEVALQHGDEALAWKYMESIANANKPIPPRLIESILEHRPSLVNPFLRWLEKHGIILTLDCANVVVKHSSNLGILAHIGNVSRNGICSSCSQRLLSSSLSNEDFAHLRSAFLDPVLIGKNIFLKTNPNELKNYLSFLDKILPVDVVLDGLNISYINKNLIGKRSSHLKNVVSHFAAQSRKILLIGRRHMKNWSSADMDFMEKRANVFLAENHSQDDPFILYATLRSGIGTKFVSRDQMNGHRHLLATPNLQRLFTKWQALHQFYPVRVAGTGTGDSVVLRPPVQVCREPQQTSPLKWHLPCVDYSQTNVEGHLQDEKSPWLCVRLRTKDMSS